MCYRDRTFCINPECSCSEGRKLTAEVLDAANEWWGVHRAAPPIATDDLCGKRQRIEKANPVMGKSVERRLRHQRGEGSE